MPPPPRPLLELELELPNGETLHLFAAHWKSKRGGERATAGYRRAGAEILRRRIAELLRDDATVDVVIAGDLNETGEVGQGVAAHIGAIPRAAPAVPGSYHYHGSWKAIDHVLLSAGLAHPHGVFYAGGLQVATDGLLTAAGAPRAMRAGGASNHLPVVVELRLGDAAAAAAPAR